MEYSVHVQMVVSAVVNVEADNPDAAIEAAYESHDMPGRMTIGAFGQASVDEAGEWEPYSVYDANGNEVWTEERS